MEQVDSYLTGNHDDRQAAPPNGITTPDGIIPIEVIYQRYFKTVYDTLGRWDRMLSEADREDLIQQAFLELWQSRNRLRPIVSMKGYLLKVAKNRFIDMKRQQLARQKREQNLTRPVSLDSPSQILQKQELGDLVRYRVTQLPTKERLAVELVWLQGLSTESAAKILGCSARTVKNRTRSAKLMLRKHLLDRG